MKTAKNPYYFRNLSEDGPFCNREKELEELVRQGKSLANVVLFSPRRFGKTSLIRRVQRRLAEEGALTLYCQLFGVTSAEDVAAKLAKAVFRAVHAQELLFDKAVGAIHSFRPVLVMRPEEEKGGSVAVQLSRESLSGMDLLEDMMESLGRFIAESGQLVHIALDEFQEITTLPGARKIEGVMRQHIQQHQAAYVFIGSRRQVLRDIFNDRDRPFFQSAINFELEPLPRGELSRFIAELFLENGKGCELPVAEYLVDLVERFPYYAQKFAFFAFECSGRVVGEEEVKAGLTMLLQEETPAFEAVLVGLAPQQIALLRALARQPTASIFAQEYLRRHRLGSVGGTQGARKKLESLDLVEADWKKVWRVVDPVFARWLQWDGR